MIQHKMLSYCEMCVCQGMYIQFLFSLNIDDFHLSHSPSIHLDSESTLSIPRTSEHWGKGRHKPVQFMALCTHIQLVWFY